MAIQRPWTNKREKRLRPGRLAVYYARLRDNGPDVVMHNELPAGRSDSHFMHSVFNSPRFDHQGKEMLSVMEELQARGYDIRTLNFSIDKEASAPHPQQKERN